jgi:hypothetical protein
LTKLSLNKIEFEKDKEFYDLIEMIKELHSIQTLEL